MGNASTAHASSLNDLDGLSMLPLVAADGAEGAMDWLLAAPSWSIGTADDDDGDDDDYDDDDDAAAAAAASGDKSDPRSVAA